MQIKDFFRISPLLKEVGYFQQQEKEPMSKKTEKSQLTMSDINMEDLEEVPNTPPTLGEIATNSETLLELIQQEEEDSSQTDNNLIQNPYKLDEYIPLWKTSEGYHRISEMSPKFTCVAIRYTLRRLGQLTSIIDSRNRENDKLDFWFKKLYELTNHLDEMGLTYSKAVGKITLEKV